MNKKPIKLKYCTSCEKGFSKLYKTRYKQNVRESFCQPCWVKQERLEKKEKETQVKLKKKLKREKVTERKLDTVFSQLVRNIYPPFCHSSKVPITVATSQCAHLVSRRYRCVRWDLRNCYPTTPAENLYNQLHVIKLAKRLESYYGVSIEDWEQVINSSYCKITELDRRFMYDVFKEALDRVYKIKLIGTDVDVHLENLRLEVIEKTKRIL